MSTVLRNAGIIGVSGIILTAWWMGWLHFTFYILGLYAAIYIASYLFKTVAIAEVILFVGTIVFCISSSAGALCLEYLSLKIMFTESFLRGLSYSIITGLLFGPLFTLFGFILGFPLKFISENIKTSKQA